MLKALIVKQIRFLLRSGKKNQKKTSAARPVLIGVLLLYALATLGFAFYMFTATLCAGIHAMGNDWLYFVFVGLAATVLGVIGSVFAAQQQLYNAKDNDLLLAMPIPPSTILISRMVVLYLQTLLFEAVVLVPAFVAYSVIAAPGTLFYVTALPFMLLLTLAAVALSCLLGFFVALIVSRIRSKSFFTVFLSLLLLAVYYFFYFKINDYISYILVNAEQIAQQIKSSAYPIYMFGRAGCGSLTDFVLFAVTILLVFAALCAFLSRFYFTIVSRKAGTTQKKYDLKTVRSVRTADGALFSRELKRFLKSPIYLLNCGLSSLILAAGAVAAIIKAGDIRALFTAVPQITQHAPLIACGVVTLVASLNLVTAPSISLEGHGISILQSLPLTARQILSAKQRLHLAVTIPFSLVCSAALAYVTQADTVMALLMLLLPALFVYLIGYMGLLFNLLLPSLDWTNEAYAVKQSMSVLCTLLCGWLLFSVAAIGYFINDGRMSDMSYTLITAAVTVIISLVLRSIVMTYGEKRFASL